MFNPQRLSLARKRRRLTGKRLADLTGLTPVTISRLEKGNNEPDAETVDRLAKALTFPTEFFHGDNLDELSKESASFRSLARMTAKEREAAIAAGSIAYMFCDWVTERFNLPVTDLLDLSYERDPESAAYTLRQYWGLGERPISNMVKLLESKGVRVFSLSENTKTVNAFSCWRNETPYVFLNTFKSAENSRFDAAHELAHLVLHNHGGPHQGKSAEGEANSFASAFLMPKSDVKACLPYIQSIETIMKAKARWRVSVAALAFRLNRLGILSDWRFQSVCKEMSRRGYRTSEPCGIEREKSVVWEKVLSELWGERVTKSHIAKTLSLPADEIEGLIFGIVGDHSLPKRQRERPELRVVK